jgi:hypothetical protein
MYSYIYLSRNKLGLLVQSHFESSTLPTNRRVTGRRKDEEAVQEIEARQSRESKDEKTDRRWDHLSETKYQNSKRKPNVLKGFSRRRRKENVKRSLFQKHTRKLQEYKQLQRDKVLPSFNFSHPPALEDEQS